ncbi:hypothetical protein [Kallotenue papyrolyticum]|uniref:hypothetical protein n=1 Tax=Kallotenue papyrolyticum TaxID=1325125 RepID=UPI00049223C6|nr:hypothetical protein [Kallotenue papyrolyticum]
MVIREILLALIRLGQVASSVLPEHTPLQLPEMQPIVNLLAGFYGYDRWVSIPLLITVIAAILIFELALFLYWLYRVILGFVPMFK